ncbi:hypothetical protein ACWJJH_03170 [Endozoicomonadaceae bacterium StTr2]
MNKSLTGLLASLLFISGCQSTHNPATTGLQAERGLESPGPASCTAIDNLSNKQNPVDIFSGVIDCLNKDESQRAAELFLTAMSYGIYDTQRVDDKTAHQAIIVLRMNALSGREADDLAQLQKQINAVIADNETLCASLKSLGKPSYTPTYMIQHGMNAFTGQKTPDGLVPDFDAMTAWHKSLKTVAECG